MPAALRTFVIGVISVSVGGLGPLTAAHAQTAPAVGVPLALYRHAGSTSHTTSGQTRARSLISRAPAASTCQAAQLSIAPDRTSGATGHIGIELRLRNISRRPCTLKGFATIVLLDGARRPLLTVLHWGPGGNAYLAMGWSHIPTPGQTCPPAPNLLVLPPAATSALLVALGRGTAQVIGPVDACGGQLAVSAVEPTPFLL
jgi:hypothetical protein